MSAVRAVAPPGFAPWWVRALHVLALWALAVVHPFLAVLARPDHVPFFAAHQARNVDIWFLVAVVAVLLPAALLALLWLAHRASKAIGFAGFVSVLGSLAFLALVPVFDRWLHGSAATAAVPALLTATALVLLYLRASWVGTFVTIMTSAAILSPALFLAAAPIRSYMATPEARDFSIAFRSEKRPTIVMIVFDELPLISLLEGEYRIDPGRYPNFHRLAGHSTWFPNTTTTHYATTGAIAGLLVGDEFSRYFARAKQNRPLTHATLDRQNVPQNLFSLLEEHYEISAIESTTRLARPSDAALQFAPPLRLRLLRLLIDSAVLYAHIVVPERARGMLPVIGGQWSGFTDIGSSDRRQSMLGFPGSAAVVGQFIEQLQRTEKPTLFYLHVLLPHYPFQFSESGVQHANPFKFLTEKLRLATGSNNWPDEASANLAWQAHLLQVGFTDLLLGQVLDRLTGLGMYDESLVIVTADHGFTFFWDSGALEPDRLAAVQASETLLVPLFIKRPGQRQGQVSRVPAQNIDILPTLANLLQLDIPWEVGGLSLFEPVPEDRQRHAYIPNRRAFGAVIDPEQLALRRKDQLFGSGTYERLYRFGPHPELVGRPVDSLPVSGPIGRVAIDDPEQFNDLLPGGRRLPVYVAGRIRELQEDPGARDLKLAVSVNGVVQSTAATTALDINQLRPGQVTQQRDAAETAGSGPDQAGDRYFLTRLAPGSLSAGANQVAIHGIGTDASGRADRLFSLVPDHETL